MALKYEECESMLQGRCFHSKKVGNNTWIKRRGGTGGGYYFVVRHHHTDIISIYTGWIYEINLDGWTSATTMQRIQQYLPAVVVKDNYNDTWRLKPKLSPWPTNRVEMEHLTEFSIHDPFRFTPSELTIVVPTDRMHPMEALIPGQLWRSTERTWKRVEEPFIASKVSKLDLRELRINFMELPKKYKWHLTRQTKQGVRDYGYFRTLKEARQAAWCLENRGRIEAGKPYGYYPTKEKIVEDVRGEEDQVQPRKERGPAEGGMGLFS